MLKYSLEESLTISAPKAIPPGDRFAARQVSSTAMGKPGVLKTTSLKVWTLALVVSSDKPM